MYQLLFRNRFVALVFVAMTVLGVRTLIGTEDEEGALTRMTEGIEAKVQALQNDAQQFQDRPRMAERPERRERPERDIVRPVPAATVFASDDELIEDAQGFEPEGQPAAPLAEGEVVIEVPPDIVLPDDQGGN
ncbi:MAG: hypothetical protein R3E09_10130 [Novosphingobium sp.]|nr:hypothetical protein [Novosphingobium sp.]